MRGWIAVDSREAADASYDRTRDYRYDTTTPNHDRVKPLDLLFLRDSKAFFAVSRVHRVETEQVERATKKCPNCGAGQIVQRGAGKYYCVAGHSFAEPATETVSVTQYRAFFEEDFAPIGAQIDALEGKPFELSNRNHLGFRACDLNGFANYVARRDYKVAAALESWFLQRALELTDREGDSTEAVQLFALDDRERPLQGIRSRRGLASFRDSVIKRYGPRCLISQCAVLSLLEAANIQPSKGPITNKSANGLLLRSDLHTLFDLDLIGIRPESLTVAIHPDLKGSEYEAYSGLRLVTPAGKEPNSRALVARWARFRRLERRGQIMSMPEVFIHDEDAIFAGPHGAQ